MTFRRIQAVMLILSFLAMGTSAFVVGFFGLELGIDFTGGSILEAEYTGERPSPDAIRETLQDLDLGSFTVQPTGETGVLLRMKDIPEPLHQQVLSLLGDSAKELRFESVGPTIGQELRQKTLLLSFLAVAAVVLYIAFAFRRTAESIRPWHWSGAALVASFHDILLPLGVFALLGYYAGLQFTVPVVVALLTVIGYSINDTVVVFDRIRENLFRHAGFDLANTVKISLQQTWFRSLSTSLTTLVVLFSMYLFGGDTLKDFALMLMAGIIAGTFSSLFVAPSLLLMWKGERFKL
ncbi:MAG: protein translocase subunit SecF [bacterium]|nr:protein translocase subunit SecF [bacterium]